MGAVQISPRSRENGRKLAQSFHRGKKSDGRRLFLFECLHYHKLWPAPDLARVQDAWLRPDETREATMTVSALRARSGQTDLQDDNRLRDAIDAVFEELGLSDEKAPRRATIEARMRDAYRRGPRHNLNLVDAGLRA
jgi:hypothetical protein